MPRKYISNLKTRHPGAFPEWAKEAYLSFRQVNANQRALPDFLVIGAQKSGSTSLFNYLGLHSAILPSVQKEIFYFNRYFDRGENWYRRYFPRQGDLDKGGMITGEASTTYLCSPEAPGRTHALIPNVKLIAVLREPAARAVSHYYHRVRAGREKRPLDIVFQEETLERWANGEAIAEADSVYLERGRYAAHIQNWLKSFPAEALLVLQSEQMFADVERVLRSVYDFLAIPNEPLVEKRIFNEGKRPQENREETVILEHLKSVYSDMNKELKMINNVGFNWHERRNPNG